MLVAEIFLQVCVSGTQTIQHRDSRTLDVNLFRLKSFRLGLKGCLLGCEELASRGEAVALALPVEASLALHSSALALSVARVASLLAPNGALVLASRQRILALSSSLVLFLRLRTILALSDGSRSGATIASLSTHRGALALASRDRQG